MISKALQFTNDMIDQFLRNQFGLEESKILLNNLIEGNGAIPEINKNKIVISLINIEKETAKPFHMRHQQTPNGNYVDINPSERYNLDILISSNFDDYKETLKFLNAVILFFQVNPIVDSTIYGNMPLGISKLTFEIEKVNYHQMQSLWTAMGAKYQPSVIYKLRLVTIQVNQIKGFETGIQATSNLVEA